MLVPFGEEKLIHSEFTRLTKSGCVIQKASKRNGLWVALPCQDHWREIGQWYEPVSGRIEAVRSPP